VTAQAKVEPVPSTYQDVIAGKAVAEPGSETEGGAAETESALSSEQNG
jgi:hypothetical protein